MIIKTKYDIGDLVWYMGQKWKITHLGFSCSKVVYTLSIGLPSPDSSNAFEDDIMSLQEHFDLQKFRHPEMTDTQLLGL